MLRRSKQTKRQLIEEANKRLLGEHILINEQKVEWVKRSGDRSWEGGSITIEGEDQHMEESGEYKQVKKLKLPDGKYVAVGNGSSYLLDDVEKYTGYIVRGGPIPGAVRCPCIADVALTIKNGKVIHPSYTISTLSPFKIWFKDVGYTSSEKIK